MGGWMEHLPVEQGLQPALMTLTVTVQESQHITCGYSGTQESSSDQPLSLPRSDQTYFPQISYVVLQRLLQML